jgi:hypothetical protein
MTLERATKMATYANLIEQAIHGRSGAGVSCSPYEQELLASTGKGRPASITIANRVLGLPFSLKTVAHPVKDLLEASTNLLPSLRMAPPAGGTSASNGREGKRWDTALGRFRVDKGSDSSIVTEYSSVTLEQEGPGGAQFTDGLPLDGETSPMSGGSSWWHECSVV